MALERVSRELTLDAPIERVFALISSPERTPEWLVGVRSVRVLTSGSIRVGSETVSQVEALGRVWEARGRCSLLEPPSRIVIESTLGPGFKSRSDSRLEAISESRTRLRAELAFHQPGGPLGMLISAFGARERIDHDFEASLRRLQQIVELGD
ncbi:MAG: SRPBCC family protein [Chloroflexota bacterium]